MRKKSIVAAIGAIGLMASPALSQETESVGDAFPWAAALIGAGVLAGWILLILEDEDENEAAPASP